ncbi:histidine kinase dimerization/phosphoacceptor domain -containing protein [Psychroserpens ponticola]|uniref:histidine kinase n=1 Tax=Psychroserpens ponticola TaxID=2932268 RepID=A0ABY7S073_9FLAO|nr:histidine kinase dimerization/phosphoacceptor domain -containing protein [Psychroserpens ponticola]WCO02707.1 ATP-binding protein [Psychroserpens ponticola]
MRIIAVILFCLFNTNLCAQSFQIEAIESALANSISESEERYKLTVELGQMLRPYDSEVEKKGYPTEYFDYINDALIWSNKNGSLKQIAAAKRFEIDYYLSHREIVKFIALANEMITKDSFATLQDKHFIYTYLCFEYYSAGYLTNYIELIPEKYRILKALNKEPEASQNEFSDIASAYYAMSQYERARAYYKKAIVSVKEKNRPFFKASINNNIGLSFSREEQADSAEVYFKKALQLVSISNVKQEGFKPNYNEHFKNVINLNIAELELNKNNYNNAINALKKESISALDLGEINLYIEANNTLSHIYFLKKEYLKALFYINKAREAIPYKQFTTLLISNLQLESKILLALDKQEESEKVYNKMNHLQDSIAINKTKRSSEIAAILYEKNKNDLEIQIQKLKLLEKNNKISSQKQQQIFYLLFIVTLLLLLFMLYAFLRKTKIQKAEIETQKLAVDQSLIEKEILLKEVHHRVKNNLQVVSSLLSKQAKTSNDESVKKLMDDGQNRINAMAMIHQQLYKTENLERINLKEYTTLLVDNISDYTEFKANIKIDIPETTFHVDVAVPYGLILNELLSNSFQYGFKGKKSGTINITITKLEEHTYLLCVEDNGIGLPSNMEEKSKKTYGLSLIKGLAWQLRGNVKYYNKKPEGCAFEITFSDNLKENV